MKKAAGQRFGYLVTVADVGQAPDGHRLWTCMCACGSMVTRKSNQLTRKKTHSCGCANGESQRKHGMRLTREYTSWRSAKGRCENETDKSYQRYGGRGIRMCREWSGSFEVFYRDMGTRPQGSTLERIDTNGHYEPLNCRWATPTEQARNRRNSVYVNWQGDKQHLSVVAQSLGITYGAAFNRLKRGKLNAAHPV